MVEPLETLLKDVKVSQSVREDMFNYCVRRGYYKGVDRDVARRQFVADVAAESPTQKQMAQDYLPLYLDLCSTGVRPNRSLGVVLTGVVAYAAGVGFGAGLLALAGTGAVVTGGFIGAYYALRRFFR